MGNHKESPEQRRERMRQEELKNPSSSIHGGGLPDLVGGLSWKSTLIMIILMIIGFVIILLFIG